MFTLASDIFPRWAVGSVAGIGACSGSLAMMFFGLFVGIVFQFTRGDYRPVFLLAGTAYLLAILLIQMLAPQLEPGAGELTLTLAAADV